MRKAPSAEDLYEHAEELINENRKRDALYDRLDALYDQEQDAGADEHDNVQIVHQPYATNAVDLVADLASQMDLTIEVPANAESDKAQRIADEQERWLQAVYDANQKTRRRNHVGEAAWAGAQRAHVCMRTLFTDALVTRESNAYKLNSVPVLIQVRDPRYVYAEDSVLGVGCVVEAYRRTAGDIRRMFPDAPIDRKDYSDSTRVDWVEYWDDTYRCYWVNGKAIGVGRVKKDVVPHGFGCLPYAFGVARTTPRMQPEKRYRPLLAGVEDNLKNIDTWFSILATAGWASVTNAWAVFSDAYGGDAGKTLNLGPNDINYFATGDQVQPVQRAPLPSDFFQLGSLLMQSMEHGTFPFAMYGQLPESIAGYAINLLTQSGRRALMPVWHAIEQCLSSAFTNIALICRNKVAPLVGEQIPLRISIAGTGERSRTIRRDIKLDTSSIGDDFEVKVTLSDPMPTDNAANLKSAMEATGSGLMSKETALTKYKVVQDAQAELERVQIQKVYEQVAPIIAWDLARKRGYIPRKIEPPPGTHFMPDGTLVPDAIQPQQEEPVPQEAQAMPNEVLQSVPVGEQQPNAADLQALFGQPTGPTLDQMAGTPPPVPQGPMI